jgi:hypothetical protein
MAEKLKVFSDCEICGRNYWSKDLTKVVRETVGYDFTGESGNKIKYIIDSKITHICKGCIKEMDKGTGAQGQLVDEHGFPATRI